MTALINTDFLWFNVSKELIPLIVAVEDEPLQPYKFDGNYVYSRPFKDIVKSTIRERPLEPISLIKITNRTGLIFYTDLGILIQQENKTPSKILYCIMVKKEFKEQVKSNFPNIPADWIELWVRGDISDISKTLAKEIQYQVINPLESEGVPIVYKNNFKEVFVNPLKMWKTIGDFQEDVKAIAMYAF